jgi:hypothetical protein
VPIIIEKLALNHLGDLRLVLLENMLDQPFNSEGQHVVEQLTRWLFQNNFALRRDVRSEGDMGALLNIEFRRRICGNSTENTGLETTFGGGGRDRLRSLNHFERMTEIA